MRPGLEQLQQKAHQDQQEYEHEREIRLTFLEAIARGMGLFVVAA
jgi:hypothetical protein